MTQLLMSKYKTKHANQFCPIEEDYSGRKATFYALTAFFQIMGAKRKPCGTAGTKHAY